MVGIIGTSEAAQEIFLGLTTLQHRGQDAAGILTYDEDGFHRVKNLGLVESVFNRENMGMLTGAAAIGHARYSTIGRGDLIDVQPLMLSYPFGLGIIHNGNIVNCNELADDLRLRSCRHLLTQSDTEIVLNLFAEKLASMAQGCGLDGPSFEHICEAVGSVFQKVNGSYSVVM
ncbi:MAG: amidophosphoribosyltransferase, partial [Bdellovibrionota bacterium]